MNKSGKSLSILDVLDVHLDGDYSEKRVRTLSSTDLDNLAAAIDDFYSNNTPFSTKQDSFYSGGWIAGNWSAPDVQQYLLASCLYYPTVVIHDPIADWFFPRNARLVAPPALRSTNSAMQIQGSEVGLRGGVGYLANREDLDRSRRELAGHLKLLSDLAPLIRSGVICPISQWHIVAERQQSILTAVRHDSRDEGLVGLLSGLEESLPSGDHIRGMGVTPQMGWDRRDVGRAVVQDPSYFFNKTMVIAETTGARYVPPASSDAALFDYKVNQLAVRLKTKAIDLKVAPAVVAAELPFFKSLDAKTLVQVRQNESAFEDWRRTMRTALRAVEESPSSGEVFATEAREVLSDALLPMAKSVRRTVSTSAHLRRTAGAGAVTLAVGGIASVAASHFTGAQLDVKDLTEIGISGVLASTVMAIFDRPKASRLDGAQAVMATLVTHS